MTLQHPLRTISLLCAVGLTTWSYALSIDSIINLPAMGVPVINYSPETNWTFGGAAQGYFSIPGQQQKMSIVQLDGAYTLNRQWYVNAQGSIYIPGHFLYQVMFRGGYRDYPDTYYELGNGGKGRPVRKAGQHYDSQRGYFHVEPSMWFSHFAVGLVGDFITETVSNITIPHDDMLMWGLGVSASYDSRNILFYPTTGLFFKTIATYYDSKCGNTTGMVGVDIDFRHFVPIYKELIFAYQAHAAFALNTSKAEIPFQMLPTLGGYDLLRGVPRGMYRDNMMWALQGELRIPIWKWIKGTVFAGLGDVIGNYGTAVGVPKVGYGLGLRASINKAKVNIRFDIARNNIDREWDTWSSYSFYLTATEAF